MNYELREEFIEKVNEGCFGHDILYEEVSDFWLAKFDAHKKAVREKISDLGVQLGKHKDYYVALEDAISIEELN